MFQYLAEGIGGGINPQCNVLTFTVGTSAVRVLKQNGARYSSIIIDNGVNACAASPRPQVTLATGIPVASFGGWWASTPERSLLFATYEHWLICATNDTPIVVVECVLK